MPLPSLDLCLAPPNSGTFGNIGLATPGSMPGARQARRIPWTTETVRRDFNRDNATRTQMAVIRNLFFQVQFSGPFSWTQPGESAARAWCFESFQITANGPEDYAIRSTLTLAAGVDPDA